NVPRDFAAHRGATAAATTSASVRRSMSCIQEQPTEGVRPDARENGQIRPSTSVRVARAAGSHPHLASVLQQGRKSAKIHVSLGVIRGIPDKTYLGQIRPRGLDKHFVAPIRSFQAKAISARRPDPHPCKL